MIKFISIFLAIILTVSTAIADNKVVGHLMPLPGELLENPILLDCGATITEMRSPQEVNLLNGLCNHVDLNFMSFVKSKGLQANHNDKFKWNLSFIPASDCYRCLNDEKYRFKDRFIRGAVIGLTDMNHKYSFMLSNTKDKDYNETFVHEIFHAMSMHFGVYDNHPGDYYKKTAADEVLAEEFTDWLGY